MAVRISKAYPFSQYHFEPEKMGPADAALFEGVVTLVERRTTASSFAKAFNAPEGQWQAFLNSLDVASFGTPLPLKEFDALEASLAPLLSSASNPKALAKAVLRRFYGYAVVQPLFDDEDLEDIFINGPDGPVGVYHRLDGYCQTNLSFDAKTLETFVSQLGSKDVYDDLRLVDGSRANIIKPPAASAPAITIRLFRQRPLSLLSLIQRNTLSPEVAAFLWVAFEGLRLYPLNIMVVGSTAAGKTTTLNALASLIPPDERVISIEDTAELNLPDRKNWVPLISGKHASAQELLANSLRMRPDRLIVGELRSREAETLFTAMNTGHRGAIGTFHANNSADAIMRLENEPMNVPRVLLPLSDLIVVQHRFSDRRHGLVRRVVQVSEVSRGDNGPALNDVYVWNSESDFLERGPAPSATIEKLANGTGKKPREIMDEITSRKTMLEYLLEHKVIGHEEVCAFFSEYYKKRD